jgi:hypothetical protein
VRVTDPWVVVILAAGALVGLAIVWAWARRKRGWP